MTAPNTRRQPPSSPASAQEAQDHRQAYHRRKTRAKVKSEALRQKETAHVEALPVQHPHAAGIDIGSRTHWVCVGFATDAASCLIREFPAHTAGLKAIAAFLRERRTLRQCGSDRSCGNGGNHLTAGQRHGWRFPG